MSKTPWRRFTITWQRWNSPRCNTRRMTKRARWLAFHKQRLRMRHIKLDDLLGARVVAAWREGRPTS